MIIELKGLPKISLNAWYSGMHWTKRKNIKDEYIKIVKEQCDIVFSKKYQYEVDYIFEFKRNALDCSNTIAILKMVEDILFEDDKWSIVNKISIQSKKGLEDKVIINVNKK